MIKRQVVLGTANDLITDFLHYDRKEDDELGMGAIEHAIISGDMTMDDILDVFRDGIQNSVDIYIAESSKLTVDRVIGRLYAEGFEVVSTSDKFVISNRTTGVNLTFYTEDEMTAFYRGYCLKTEQV